MADCCAELRSELAALRAEVAKLKPVDENTIIKKAIEGATALLKPEIAGLGLAVAGAVKQADLSIYLTKQLRPEVTQAVLQSRSASLAAEHARKLAAGAIDLGELASMKSTQAVIKSKMAAAEAAVAKALSSEAQKVAAGAATKATLATKAASVAQGVASAANTFANSALGKVILLAANVLSLAGSIAGLFALYATLKVVFPRLDAHDRQLAQHDSELSKQMSLIVKQAGQIKQVEHTANKALQTGERALGETQANTIQIYKLRDKTDQLEVKTNKAIGKADQAIKEAQSATNKANDANAKAIDAISTADLARVAAEYATNRANSAYGQSQIAIGEAGIAASTANNAQKEATKATGTANRAIGEVETLQPKVTSAQQVASEAKTISNSAINTATDANSKADTANKKADSALGQIPSVENKANTALTNSNGALLQSGAAISVANTALNIANNALNKVPTTRDTNTPNLRSPELENRINKLETKVNEQEEMNQQVVTKIDNLPKIIEPTIVNSVTKTVNAIVPISIEQARADVKRTFEDISIRNQQALEPKFQRVIDNQRASNNEIINSVNTPLFALPDLVANKVRQVDRPITINQPRDTETLEKLAQVVVGVGALKIALDNIPKNVAKSPELLNTVVRGATTANCGTAQPGGCTARAINNGVNNALNNNNGKLGDLLKGLMQAGNTALDLDTNSRVKDLQKSATILKQITGADDFPMVLPEYLLDDFIDTPKIIPNQVAYNVWLLKQIDALVGLFPIKIERTDENGQKQMLVYENIAEAMAEITGLLAEIAFDADTSVNVGVHATSEAIGAKIAAVQGNSYLKSIVDYLGFQGSHKSINVPISCTPGAVGLDDKLQENELGDFLKSSTQKAIGWECTERDDLHSIIKRILFDGEIARAALYKPIKPPKPNTPQSMTGDTIKADRKKEKDREDKEWDLFKQRIKNQEGTGIDIDINEKPLSDEGSN
jgi:hypothetical protein